MDYLARKASAACYNLGSKGSSVEDKELSSLQGRIHHRNPCFWGVGEEKAKSCDGGVPVLGRYEKVSFCAKDQEAEG